jgi:hypothetical protein
MPQLGRIMARLVEAGVGLRDIQRHEVTQRSLYASQLTPYQIHTLEIVSLSCAIVSILAAVVTFYWFVRMRRSFRQECVFLYS